MPLEFFPLMAIIFIGLFIVVLYETKKKNEVKLEQIKLERETIALEQKRLEIENIESYKLLKNLVVIFIIEGVFPCKALIKTRIQNKNVADYPATFLFENSLLSSLEDNLK